MTAASRLVLSASRAALGFGLCVLCCNLYEGRTLELFADGAVAAAECRDGRGCPRDRAACARGVCVECLVDADCGPAKPACVGNACVECRAPSDCRVNQTCNVWLAACAFACVEASDCAGQPASLCSPELELCVECLADADCGEPRKPACDRGGRCVECNEDAHCPPDRPSCELAARRCVECVDSSQCDGGRVCDPRDFRCVECLVDADCEGGTCEIERRRCRRPCGESAECGAKKPICDGSGLCVECDGDAACVDPKRPACNAERQCVQCTLDAHCTDPKKPACITATERCGECTRDEHCPAAERCDLMAARCAPQPPGPAPGVSPGVPPAGPGRDPSADAGP